MSRGARNILLLLLAGLAGCARFSTVQTDRSYTDACGNEVREITTKAKATTFFDARSALANFKATQTDKSQSASVGALNQEAYGTNVAKLVEAVATGVVQGLKKAP